MKEDDDMIGELKGSLITHMQTCDSFKKALLTSVGLFITVSLAAYGYLISSIDEVKNNHLELRTEITLLKQNDGNDRADLNSRLTSIVTANVQREASMIDRVGQIKGEFETFKKELREEVRRDNGSTRR